MPRGRWKSRKLSIQYTLSKWLTVIKFATNVFVDNMKHLAFRVKYPCSSYQSLDPLSPCYRFSRGHGPLCTGMVNLGECLTAECRPL